jgi:excisionase family DNA binding protein
VEVSESQFLTVREAARVLHCSPRMIRARLARGEIDAVRLGSGPKAPIRIASGDIVRYLQRVNSSRSQP